MAKQNKIVGAVLLDSLVHNNNIIKLYIDHTGNMHDTIDTQQIMAHIMDKYIRYSEASKMSWYHKYIITIIH